MDGGRGQPLNREPTETGCNGRKQREGKENVEGHEGEWRNRKKKRNTDAVAPLLDELKVVGRADADRAVGLARAPPFTLSLIKRRVLDPGLLAAQNATTGDAPLLSAMSRISPLVKLIS